MFVIIGLLVVIGSVLGGFTIAGGQIPVLFQPSEFIAVGGTAIGTVLIATPGPTLKALSADMPKLMKPNPFSSTLYLNALKMMFELFQMAQRDGLVAIESHIEEPENSELFKRYPDVLKQHHAITFLCDSLRLVLLGSVPPMDLDMMMESEIEVHHEQESMSVKVLQRVSDSLPGIGIVAAVLGIVVTMGHINGSIESIGAHVGAALTGTLLGVLLAYGFTSPLGSALENTKANESRFYYFIKASVVAMAKGSSPMIATEFARRSIFTEVRPSFNEMDEACKALKQQAKAAA